MGARKERFTYSDLLECFQILRGRTDGRAIAYLVALVGGVVMEGDLRAKLHDLVRKRKVARHGCSGESTYSIIEVPRGGEAVRLKKEKSSRSWDGLWTALTYDMPTSRNSTRRRLARLLHQMGFAPLSGSSWLSPYDWLDFLREILSQWQCNGIVSYVRSAEVVPFIGGEETCSGSMWDLAGIAMSYERIADRCDRAPHGATSLAQRSRARICFAAAKELDIVEEDDPMLPARLLPDGWPRQRVLRSLGELRVRLRHDVESAVAVKT